MKFRLWFYVCGLALGPRLRADICGPTFQRFLPKHHVSQAKLNEIVPPLEKPLRDWLAHVQSQVGDLQKRSAPLSEIIAVSNATVQQLDKRLKAYALETRIIQIPTGQGLTRDAIQIIGGKGQLGAAGRRLNADATRSPFQNDALLLDPYLQLTGRVKSAIYIAQSGTELGPRGPRLPLASAINPFGLARAASHHEIGHNAEQILREKGLDSGFLGAILPGTRGALPIEGYGPLMWLGENPQYTLTARLAMEEVHRQESIARDPQQSPAIIENALVSAEKARSMAKAALYLQRQIVGYSLDQCEQAARIIRMAPVSILGQWQTSTAHAPMKNHMGLSVPLTAADGSVAAYYFMYVPEKFRGQPAELRTAILKSLTKTAGKLRGLQRTAMRIGNQLDPVVFHYAPNTQARQSVPPFWHPIVEEKIILKTPLYNLNAEVTNVVGDNIHIQWNSPRTGQVQRGEIHRASGKFSGQRR